MTSQDAIKLVFGTFNGLHLLSYATKIWRVNTDRHGVVAIPYLTLLAAALLSHRIALWACPPSCQGFA